MLSAHRILLIIEDTVWWSSGMVSDQWEAGDDTQQPIRGQTWSERVWVVWGWWQLVTGGSGVLSIPAPCHTGLAWHDDSKCGVVWCPGVIIQIHQRPSEEVMLARMQRTHQTFTNNNFVYRVINPIHHPAQVTAAQGAAVRDWFLEIFSPKHKLFSICIY